MKNQYKSSNLLFGKIFLLSALFLLMASTMGFAQIQIVYYTPGTVTWTVPSGVTSVTIYVWAGGGAGSGSASANTAGGGGGGGAFTQKVLSVTAGTTYSVTVGAGGTGTTGAGGAGGSSWFGSTSTLLATGGKGSAAGGASGTSGGAYGSCVPATNYPSFSGGNGAPHTTSPLGGGGGGGSAGTGTYAGAGQGQNAPANGIPNTGGLVGQGSTGGNGANGVTGPSTGANGATGNVPGGGGAGSFTGSSGTSNTGGNGGGGVVTLTYQRTFTWTGGDATTEWEDPQNWDAGTAYPGQNPQDIALINSTGTVGCPIITAGDGTIQIQSVTISGSGNTLGLGAGAYLQVSGTGATTSPINTTTGGTVVADPASTIEYSNATGGASVGISYNSNPAIVNSSFTYGNLYLSTGTTSNYVEKNFTGATTIAGNLTFSKYTVALFNGTFNVNLGGNLTLESGVSGYPSIGNSASTPIIMNTNGSTFNSNSTTGGVGEITANANISFGSSTTNIPITTLVTNSGATVTIPSGETLKVSALTNAGNIAGPGTLYMTGVGAVLPGTGTNNSNLNVLIGAGSPSPSINASTTVNSLTTNSGLSTFSIGSGATLTVTSTFVNNGTIYGPGTLSLPIATALPGGLTGTGTFDASGSLSLVIGNGGTNTVTTASAIVVNNLTINQTAGAANTALSSGSVTVKGVLDFVAGNILTFSYSVINSGGSITGAGQSTGWVSGNLENDFATNAGTATFKYEIGTSSEYTPATLAISNVNIGAGAVNITGYVASSDADESHGSGIGQSTKANVYWFLSKAGAGTFTSYSPTFDFTNASATGTPSSYIIRQYNPSSWALTTNSVSGNTATATGITSMGAPTDFEVGDECNTTSNATVSTCDTYTWNGTTYTSSATPSYFMLGAAAGGCDSIANLNLTINYTSSPTSYSVTACDSYSLPWGGTVTTSGSPNHTYTNAGGCDSVVTANVTINYTNSSTNSVTTCNSYYWNGTTYYTGGSYSYDAGNNVSGCDSVANLNLTINYTSSSSASVTACDSYVWNGTTYTTGGTYTFDAGNNASGCDSVATLILTINYSPTVSITGVTAICINGTTTLSPTSGGTWASSDNTLATVTSGGVVTGVATGSPTFTFTTDAGCSATTGAVTINNCCVAPAAPTGSSPQSFCSGMPHTVANLAITGTDIKVYSVATGGTALASTVTLANGKTYYASQTISCESSRLPVAVVINGSPAVSGIAGAAAVCASSSTTLTSITLTDATAGGVWSVTPGTGTASIDDSGNLTGLTAGSVIVSYAVTAVNGCTTTPTKAVNVNGTPVASIASSLSPICNKTRTAIVLASSETPATYSYTASGDAFVTGFVSGKAAVIAQTLTNTGTTQGVVTYTVTPVYAGCTGSAITTSVTVNPVATGTATPSPDPICTGATTGITLNPGAVAGITFSWTYVNTVTVTGANSCAFTDGTCGTSINDVLSNSGTVNGTNTYSITPWANGCAGTVFRDVVTVRPVPTVSTVDGGTTICNKTRTDIVFTGTTAGTIYTHTASGDAGTSGFSTGTGVTIAQTLYNSGATPGVVTYTITPTYDGCPGASITANVTVNPVATGSATPAANAICSGTSAGLTLNAGPVSGTSFEYTSVSTVLVTNTVTGATASCTSGCGTSITDALSNGGTANGSTTYTITPWANGCAGTAFKDIVTVRPVPVVYTTVSSPYSVCSGTKTYIPLKSYTAGATFSFSSSDIDGLVSGYLDGSGALIAQTLVNTGTAQGVVTYSVTPTYELCDGAAITIPVTVNPVATGSATPSPQGICTGFAAGITLIPGSVSGTNFTWVASVVSTISGATSCADTSGACGTMINSVLHSTATSPVEIYTITPYANGCAGTKFIEDVTVQSGNPVKPAIVGTSTKICPATDYTYTVSNLGSFTDVIWTIPSGCTITTGSLTSNPIVIEYPEGYSSGTLTAIATNQCGNASTTGSLATNTRGSSCRISENTSPEVGSSMNMTAYPNPAHDVLNVQFNRDQAGSYKLELMDLTGRLMLNQVNAAQQGSNLVEISLGNYAKGVYMLSLTTDDGNRQVVRIVVE